jgi:hypothetical protein
MMNWNELMSKTPYAMELAVASGVETITTFNTKGFKGVEEDGAQVLSPKTCCSESNGSF